MGQSSLLLYVHLIAALMILAATIIFWRCHMKKYHLNRSLIFSFGLLAVSFATGIIFGALILFDISLSMDVIWQFTSCYSGLILVIWIFLLCKNC